MLIVVACVIAVAAIVASFVSLPYYALTPGNAQAVEPLISVPSSLKHHHKGSIQLVDVEVTPIRAIDWIYFKLDNNASVVPSSAILGPSTPQQYNTEGVIDMATAQQAATVVALRELGYKVPVKAAGALLYALQPGSPAENSLLVGDTVTRASGTAVTSASGLASALSRRAVGATVRLTVSTWGRSHPHVVAVRLGSWHWTSRGPGASLDCVPAGRATHMRVALLLDREGALSLPKKGEAGHPVACLGVLSTEDAYKIAKLPFAVNLQSEGIVGPSAGLAFTLGLMQKLDRLDLTGGRKVAATGTMDIFGNVGAIGGVQQKTIAVRAAGASIFFVPNANFARAKAFAGPQLKIYAVSSIGQVLRILKRLGGRIAPAQP
ncbi:MAG: S16 family serine protease [Acidimicrobiales bacterium]